METDVKVQRIERFQGFIISKDGRGYFWDDPNWGAESEDYFATVEECRADIADWNSATVDDDINPHEDSPSLDAPWWEQR